MLDKFLVALPKVLSWIQIFLSPFLIGVILGGLTYFYFNDSIGEVGGVLILAIGFFTGIWFAEKARKKYGTNEFMTKVSSTTPSNSKRK